MTELERKTKSSMQVAILLFDEVEVLDFAGPFEVFGVTRTPSGEAAYEVVTVSPGETGIRTRNGLRVTPDAGITTLKADVLVVPGGQGTRALLSDPRVHRFLCESQAHVAVTLSVCTGALLLASAGLLRDMGATTHVDALDELRTIDPSIEIFPLARVVDNGRILTSAGVSAGIDAALYLVSRLSGPAVAAETARYMQYDWRCRCLDGETIVTPARRHSQDQSWSGQ
ncbi:DJ-1/PfpI family protein [soil metagenome]